MHSAMPAISVPRTGRLGPVVARIGAALALDGVLTGAVDGTVAEEDVGADEDVAALVDGAALVVAGAARFVSTTTIGDAAGTLRPKPDSEGTKMKLYGAAGVKLGANPATAVSVSWYSQSVLVDVSG